MPNMFNICLDKFDYFGWINFATFTMTNLFGTKFGLSSKLVVQILDLNKKEREKKTFNKNLN